MDKIRNFKSLSLNIRIRNLTSNSVFTIYKSVRIERTKFSTGPSVNSVLSIIKIPTKTANVAILGLRMDKKHRIK